MGRSNCPALIRQVKVFFDKAFSPGTHVPTKCPPNSSREAAHHVHGNINYSRASTHLGNSLVLYYPTANSTTAVVGSIDKITLSPDGAQLLITRQAPLPPGGYDPFRRYPSFPATVYSSEMDSGPKDKVSFDSIVSHVARFKFSNNRAVILNLSRVRLTHQRLLQLLTLHADLAYDSCTMGKEGFDRVIPVVKP